jgi:glutaredoxin 2
MTENSLAIFNFLKKHYGKEFTKHELVEKANVTMAAVNGSLNALKTKNIVQERIEETAIKDAHNQPVVKKLVSLTEYGAHYDPEEEERKKAQLKAEEKALRKEKRAQEKAERARKNSVL